MSYLNPLRLHFAGRFQAAPSTVNNDITHFNNASFLPEYQKLQTPDSANGWWNPRGDADWRLIGCRITSAWLADGSAAAPDDLIHQYLIADSDLKTAAKLVDLDPQQQMVSEIWGLEVRICNANGDTLLQGQYHPAAFMDLWGRATTGAGGDMNMGAMYQSQLFDLSWGDIAASPFLQQLKAAAVDGLLSIKFNVDGYNMDITSPEFTRGRIVGTLGPVSAGEPRFFVAGRQFMVTPTPSQSYNPPTLLNYCTAVVATQAGKVLLDLGNGLPTTTPGGPMQDQGTLSLVCRYGPNNAQTLALGDIDYTPQGWYEQTAGVVSLPADRALTAEELNLLAANPLALLLPDANGAPTPAITEAPGGVYVRADPFVFRLNPGELAKVQIYATAYGQPEPGQGILLAFDPSQLQGGPGQPDPATPEDAITFPGRVVTGADGTVTLAITGHNPGNPRGYIDGQVYGVRPVPEEIVQPGGYYPLDPANFISLLLWNAFQPDEPVTWYGSLQSIFQQYANLYPIMDRFLELGSYESICANLRPLRLAFALDAPDPNSMPVTRDLSPAKRRAILRWLNETGPDGKPLLGTPPIARPTSQETATETAQAPTSLADVGLSARGGKTAAASRRIGPHRVRRPR